MPERAQTGQGERQDAAPRPPAGVRDEADATRVVLETTVIKRVALAIGHAGAGLLRARSVGRQP
jgi:hypothetical protein